MYGQLQARNVGGGGYNADQSIHNESYANPIQQKWGAFLEHINPDHPRAQSHRRVLSMVLNESHKAIPSFISESMGGHLMESSETRTSAIASYANTIFPVLMRVFPNLIAHEIVSIQPMAGPVSAVHYFEGKYGTNKSSIKAGQNLVQTFDESYSSQRVRDEAIQQGNGTDFGGGGNAFSVLLGFRPVFPAGSLTGTDVKVVLKEVDSSGAIVQSATDNGQGAFVFEPAGGNTAGVIDYATGQVSGFKFQNAPASGNIIFADYQYNMEGNELIPNISMDVRTEAMIAEERKLNAVWSFEAAQDLASQHGIDAENELMTMVSNQIGLELDREIIQDIHDNVTFTGVFNRNGGGSGISEIDHLRTIFSEIGKISADIHTATKRGMANWIIASPQVTAIFSQFQTHGDFIPASPTESRPMTYGNRTSDYGIYKVGSLMNRLAVYQDPYMKSNDLLIGFRGENYLDAGYVYAPYIPLRMTKTFEDPTDGKNKKGFMTRYGKKLLRPEYYGKLTILNL